MQNKTLQNNMKLTKAKVSLSAITFFFLCSLFSSLRRNNMIKFRNQKADDVK